MNKYRCFIGKEVVQHSSQLQLYTVRLLPAWDCLTTRMMLHPNQLRILLLLFVLAAPAASFPSSAMVGPSHLPRNFFLLHYCPADRIRAINLSALHVVVGIYRRNVDFYLPFKWILLRLLCWSVIILHVEWLIICSRGGGGCRVDPMWKRRWQRT